MIGVFLLISISQAESFTCDISKSEVSVTYVKEDYAWNLTCEGETRQLEFMDSITVTGKTNQNSVIVDTADGSSRYGLTIWLDNTEFASMNTPCLKILGPGDVEFNIKDVKFSTTNCDVITSEGGVILFSVFSFYERQFSTIDVTGTFSTSGNYCFESCNVTLNGLMQADSIEFHYSSLNKDKGTGRIFANKIALDNSVVKASADADPAIGGPSSAEIDCSDCDITATSNNGPGIGGAAYRLVFARCNISANSQSNSAIGSMDNTNLDISIMNSRVSATSANAAAIGGRKSSGHIFIWSCEVSAQANQSSGIGSASSIIVQNSKVEATTTGGTAIGGGVNTDVYEIAIVSCTINCSSLGTSGSIATTAWAGIGGGQSDHLYELFIRDSTIYAKTLDNGAAIGGGYRSFIDVLDVSQSRITCEGGPMGAGLGGGCQGTSNLIYIHDCEFINSTTGASGAAVGGGHFHRVYSFQLVNCTVYAESSYQGAGIGCGYTANINDFNITRCNLTARSGVSGAAIGSSCLGAVFNFTISDSVIDAFSGYRSLSGVCNAAAIGGGMNSGSGDLIITRCNVTAISGYSSMGAGIGGGLYGWANITLIDSNIVARSSFNSTGMFAGGGGPGIGGGAANPKTGTYFNNATITIIRCNVSAFGSNIKYSNQAPYGLAGAGIGYGGLNCNPHFTDKVLNVTIEDSIVYAYGGNTTCPKGKPSAAIMGGDQQNATILGTCHISGSTVYAVGGSQTDSFAPKAIIGYNWWRPEDTIHGKLIVSNSQIYFNHPDDDNESIPLVLANAEVSADSKIFANSNFNQIFQSYSTTIEPPVLVLQGLSAFNLASVSVLDSSNNVVAERTLSQFDVATGITVPSPGRYHVQVKVDEERKYLVPRGNSNFDVSAGFNEFGDLELVADDGNGGLGAGAIAGIAVGAVAAIAVGVVVFFLVRRTLKNKKGTTLLADDQHSVFTSVETD